MEIKNILFDKEYLSKRLSELDGYKKKEFTFEIKNSDRPNSLSLYIALYQKIIVGDKEKDIKGCELRISDHYSKNCLSTQMIIDPNCAITKKQKNMFAKSLNNLVRKSKLAWVKFKFKNLYNINIKGRI